MALYYFVYLILIMYVAKVTKRCLHMLQQNLYNENNRYLRWIFKNLKSSVLNFSIISCFLAVFTLFIENRIISDFLLVLIISYSSSYSS